MRSGNLPTPAKRCDDRSRHLSADSRIGSTRDSQLRHRTESENQDRVKHDIRQRPHGLGDHRTVHIAPRLMDLRPVSFQKCPDAADTDDLSVDNSTLDRFRGIRTCQDIRTHTEDRENGKYKPGSKRQKRACSRCFFRLSRHFLCIQRAM